MVMDGDADLGFLAEFLERVQGVRSLPAPERLFGDEGGADRDDEGLSPRRRPLRHHGQLYRPGAIPHRPAAEGFFTGCDSSWHISTRNGAPESLVSTGTYGNGTADYGWGGFEYQTMGYLTRGQGAWAIPNVPGPSSSYITTMGGGPVSVSGTVNAFPHVLVPGCSVRAFTYTATSRVPAWSPRLPRFPRGRLRVRTPAPRRPAVTSAAAPRRRRSTRSCRSASRAGLRIARPASTPSRHTSKRSSAGISRAGCSASGSPARFAHGARSGLSSRPG